jgi:hypothetical protein
LTLQIDDEEARLARRHLVPDGEAMAAPPSLLLPPSRNDEAAG